MRLCCVCVFVCRSAKENAFHFSCLIKLATDADGFVIHTHTNTHKLLRELFSGIGALLYLVQAKLIIVRMAKFVIIFVRLAQISHIAAPQPAKTPTNPACFCRSLGRALAVRQDVWHGGLRTNLRVGVCTHVTYTMCVCVCVCVLDMATKFKNILHTQFINKMSAVVHYTMCVVG